MSNYTGLICPHCNYQTGIDPALITEDSPMPYCANCGEQLLEYYQDDDDGEKEFIPCSRCDGHPACEDFGCAFNLGLGHLVKEENPFDW